jgi:DNA polymerase III subunit delta
VPELKPAYLVHGDDDARIDAWRGRLRARAESERGPGGLQSFDARASEPDRVAAAMAELTFEPGARYLLVDDAGAWKAAQLAPLEEALAPEPPPDTVLVLIVRGKPLKALVTLVERAGGEVRAQAAPKAWELPKWVVERARELGLQVDTETARALIGVVGASQQRLARELEKLALAIHPATRLTVDDVEELAAGDAAPRVYDLADALAAGDLRATLALGEELLGSGERPGGLVYPIARSLRQFHSAARLLDAGISEKEAAGKLGMPPWLAKKTLAKARDADRETLERALCAVADLELELRGESDLDDASAFSLALARAAG